MLEGEEAGRRGGYWWETTMREGEEAGRRGGY
jgi:hypothetical protein